MGRIFLLFAIALATQAEPPRAVSAKPVPSVEKLLKDGATARGEDRIDDAITLYRQAVKLAPQTAEAWWYLGMCLYEKDRYSESELAFGKLSAMDRTNGSALAMLGLSEYRNKKHDAALKHLLASKTAKEPVQAGSQMDTVTKFHIIALLNHIGQHDLGSVFLQEFAGEKPDTPQLIEAAGINLLRLTDLPGEVPAGKKEQVDLAGRAVLLTWRGKAQEGRGLAAELQKKYPTLPNAHYLMGYILMLMNDPGMLGEMQKEVDSTPGHVPARLQIANEYMKRGESEKGLSYAQDAVRLEPKNFMAFQILGRLQLDAGDIAGSIASLERAVELAPECLQCRTTLANSYGRAGRQADAERQLKIRADLAKTSAASAAAQSPGGARP